MFLILRVVVFEGRNFCRRLALGFDLCVLPFPLAGHSFTR